MRTCSKCDGVFSIVNGIWQCKKCYEEKDRPMFHCKECEKNFLSQYVKKPVECRYCGSYYTEIIRYG